MLVDASKHLMRKTNERAERSAPQRQHPLDRRPLKWKRQYLTDFQVAMLEVPF